MDLKRLSFALTGAGFLIAACSVSDTKKVSDDDGGGGSTAMSSTSSGMTDMCEQTCIPQHPDGEADYRALRECLLCNACADACASGNGGICATPAEAGCSAGATSCGECVASECALVQDAMLNFAGICAGAGQACSMNVACVSLNNCVSNCALGTTSTTTSTGAGGAGSGGGGVGGN